MPDQPLRTAFLNHYVDWGGAEGMLLTLFEAVDRQRVAPTLVVPGDGRLPEGARAAGIPVVIVPVSDAVLEVTRGGGGPLTSVRAAVGLVATIARLTRSLRAMNVDVVVTNSAKAHVYGSIAGRLSRKPVVWRLHDTLDSPDFGAALYKLMIAIAKRIPRVILSVSDSCAAPLIREGVDPSRVVTLYNGIDLGPFTAVARRAPGAGKPFIVGSFGRLTPLKGHDVVIRAVAQLAGSGRDVQLVIAGGPAREAPGYADELHGLAEELGISDRLRIDAGFPDGGLPGIMEGVDVVAQASVLPDSLPTTVIEAMAGGRAVVASAIGGCPELVDHDRTGLLFEPGNVDALAQGLTVLAGDPAALERMGAAAREDAVRRFAVDAFANSFCDRLEEVAAAGARS